MPQFPASMLERVSFLPESPGVYLWRGADGTVLYVGKAKRLRSRVRSYVASDHWESIKTRALMLQAESFDTIVVSTEAEALILEANLIKEHKPKYNIALRDDKSYPYIKVTVQEPYPRVFVTRQLVNDGGRYFGPYTDVGAMRRALNVVKRIFTVRSCNYDMPRVMPDRPCLDYHIGRCKAPCIFAQSQADYGAMIDEVVLFLDGRTDEVIRRVKDRIAVAANQLDFERAGELHDALQRLEHMEEPTMVMEVEGGDRDVVGYARDGDDACVALLRIRAGKLLARDQQFIDNVEGEDDATVLEAYLDGPYRLASERAGELLLPFAPADMELLDASLEARLHVPQRGARRDLVELATQNARHLLEESRLVGEETEERAADPVYELQRQLGLQRVPRSLVCFDISHAQGTDTVASCVWFQNGRPLRAEYRKFKVKTVEGIDDFASMAEVVTRFFRRRLEEQRPLPDLVVIDGGKGQLSSAHEAMVALGLDALPVISLAKREEEVFLPGRSDPILLRRRSPALKLLQQARDEAHRFAITFQRKRRAVRTITSELLRIPGVGDAKRRQLLQAFGSLHGVRAAPPEAIAALPGFSLLSAQKILDALAAEIPATIAAANAPQAAAPDQTAADVPDADRSIRPIQRAGSFDQRPTSERRTVSVWHLECSGCGQTMPGDVLASVCAACGQPYLVRYDSPFPGREAITSRWDMWRYAAILPLSEGEQPVTLGEGCTPVSAAPGLAREIGVASLWIKDEGLNPTASFKARGMSAAVTRALGLKVPGLVAPTAGNAGAALSAYGAAAGIPVRIYAPETTPSPILETIRTFGAELHLVQGHIGDAGKQARAFSAESGYFDVATLREPYRIEGKKTMGIEVAEQLGWRLPTHIIYPTGGGTGLIGMWKVFRELIDAGWLPRDTVLPQRWSSPRPTAAPRSSAPFRLARTTPRPGRTPPPTRPASGCPARSAIA